MPNTDKQTSTLPATEPTPKTQAPPTPAPSSTSRSPAKASNKDTGIKKFFGPIAPKTTRTRPSRSSPPPPSLVAAKRPAEDMAKPSSNPKPAKKAHLSTEPDPPPAKDGLGDTSMADATRAAAPTSGSSTLPPSDNKDKLSKARTSHQRVPLQNDNTPTQFKLPLQENDDDEPTFEDDDADDQPPPDPDFSTDEALSAYLPEGLNINDLPSTNINGVIFTYLELAMPPPQGWPTIFGANFATLTAGVSDVSKRAWTIATGPRSIILVAFARPRSEYTIPQIEELERLMRKILPPGTEFELAICTIKNMSNGTAPQPILLYKVPRDILNGLNAQRVFSFPELTFFIFPKTSYPDTFVMTIKGLTYPATAASEEKVTSLIKFTLQNNKRFIDWFYNKAHQSPGVDWTSDLVEEWIEETIETITTSALLVPDDGGAFPVFRTHMAPPTNTLRHLNALHGIMKSLEYGGLRGTGRALATDFSCGCCRARDHPTSKCAYRDIPGFFGGKPPRMTSPAPPTPSASSGIITLDEDDDDAPTFDIPANTNQSRGRSESAWSAPVRGAKRGGRGGRGTPRGGRGGF